MGWASRLHSCSSLEFWHRLTLPRSHRGSNLWSWRFSKAAAVVGMEALQECQGMGVKSRIVPKRSKVAEPWPLTHEGHEVDHFWALQSVQRRRYTTASAIARGLGVGQPINVHSSRWAPWRSHMPCHWPLPFPGTDAVPPHMGSMSQENDGSYAHSVNTCSKNTLLLVNEVNHWYLFTWS